VLIIDSIGLLSSVYRYADIAYIGGGFGKGIHNTLEAATFGKPVIFGPNYKKFNEAIELIQKGAGFYISNHNELNNIFSTLLQKKEEKIRAGALALDYVNKMRGGTEKILQKIILKTQ
jgi:3-deoxy-D-manno-octulosonic-acid transferase